MDTKFQLRVITPEEILVDEPVTSLTFPGLDGLYGVLPNHAPLITGVDSGQLTAKTVAGSELNMFVTNGFAQVAGNVVRLVCDAGESAGAIDVERAKASEGRARERLRESATNEEIDAERARASLFRAMTRIRIATRR